MDEEQTFHTVNFPKFGEFTYSGADVVRFPWGLPGFAHLREFIVLSLEEQPHFIWLQSLEDIDIALPMVDPWSLFADYDPKLPQYAVMSLEIERPESFAVFCVTVVTKGAAEMTVNLRAPVVVNIETRIGRQVALDNPDYSMRQPVPRIEDVPAKGQEALSP